jgi:hypothetical protein
MAGGIAKDGAVQDQIDATIADAVSHARHRLPYGERLKNCARIKVTVALIRCGHIVFQRKGVEPIFPPLRSIDIDDL